jgi:hypothetical protein
LRAVSSWSSPPKAAQLENALNMAVNGKLRAASVKPSSFEMLGKLLKDLLDQ